VLNISRSGALVHTSGMLGIGSAITLLCGSLQILAHAAWVGGPRAGLAFDRLITDAQLEQILTGDRLRLGHPALRSS
jgi:hypothetical protein